MQVSKRIAAARPLATTAMHERVDVLKLQGEEVIDFSIAISHFPAPEHVRAAVAEAVQLPLLPYTAVGGAAALRQKLAAKVGAENAITASAAEVIVTNGAKQALYQSLYVMTDPGDTVIVFRPHWPAYVATSQLLGLNIVLVDQPARIDAAFLDTLPRAKVLIVNNPHNPSGKVFAREELLAIADWLRARSAHCIVDESYEKLIFEGQHHSLAALAKDWAEIGVVTIFSASQSYAMMGWRAGFAVAPAVLVKSMEALQGPITAAVPALSQVAAEAAFATGDVPELVADYRERRDLVVGMFSAVPWIKMTRPDSGPYLWGDISGLTMDTNAFAETLIEQYRVAIMPGEALGCAGFIRIGYIADDVATLKRGVDAIIALGNKLAAAGRAA
ncbi:pyridoxal phosphate-dependent aminotransferase [Massilia sp. BJB1822]|uniref:pyridoxal phosphate-dependent aminotransferase n=1 Tax=Massilia sp. BJB1822 TaxID=2744470 RepID=UPI001593682E|nr:aminotransferase class I/II-fold pyridoxal phosphate-dependent enzyme [Massilia sp. BJB1822]NVD97315.1 aminotransferase class I/II-fold pyridoxal phosphate-dependent enzyme [Massilia sp. BJB1822]